MTSQRDETDGRRARGDRTRQAVADGAAALATVHGLSGISIAQVAAELGLSKSSVQAAFGTKEELQLGAIRAGTAKFIEEVVVPASASEDGLARLKALVARYLDYVDDRVFPGGCFMSASFADFDSRPGPVRDALAAMRRQWLGLLEASVAVAQDRGELDRQVAPQDVAFEVDAVLGAANVGRNLTGTDAPLKAARRLLEHRLQQPATTTSRQEP